MRFDDPAPEASKPGINDRHDALALTEEPGCSRGGWEEEEKIGADDCREAGGG